MPEPKTLEEARIAEHSAANMAALMTKLAERRLRIALDDELSKV
jgi:hypothetical protein